MKFLLLRKQQIDRAEALAVALAPSYLKQQMRDLDLIHFVDGLETLAAMIGGCTPQGNAVAIACLVHLLHAELSSSRSTGTLRAMRT